MTRLHPLRVYQRCSAACVDPVRAISVQSASSPHTAVESVSECTGQRTRPSVDRRRRRSQRSPVHGRPCSHSLLFYCFQLHCIGLLLFSLWQIVSRSAFESSCARNGVDAVRACIAAGQNIHAVNVRTCQQCILQLRRPVESGVFLL
jgi:hypothetical protein